MLFPRESESREVKDLSGIWRFSTDPDGVGRKDGWQKSGLPAPMPMCVPASYNDITNDPALRDYIGDVWYETDFFVPRGWKNERIVLRFGSATHKAEVWVNGVSVMSHKGGYLPFETEISESVTFDAPNRITVCVDNILDWTTIPPGEIKTYGDDHPAGYKTQVYHHDFFNYAGLHRPVRLYTTPQSYVSDITLNTDLSGKADYAVKAEGNASVSVRILDASGASVAQGEGASGSLTVPNPILWNVGAPYLYTFEVRLADGDVYRLPFGIRTVEVKNDQFLINGAPIYFQGFGKHEDMEVKGKGLDLAMILKDFHLLKDMGANSFRTSHYPYSEEIMNLADELGFAVIDETTAVGFQFWNGETVFRPDRVGDAALAHHLDVIRELYERDKNHPSVVMWSVANEPRSEEDGARVYFEKVIGKLRELEHHRPITMVMNVKPEEDQVGELVDVISVNTYESWYSDPGHSEVISHRLPRIVGAWHERYHKPILMSEFGADAIAGFHQTPPVMFTEEYQVEVLKEYAKVMDSLPYVIGEHVWAFADFATKQGITRMDGNKKGVYTRSRRPKMAAHYLSERWNQKQGKK